MRIQLAALLALSVAFTILGSRTVADSASPKPTPSASPKPTPAMSCIEGYTLTVERRYIGYGRYAAGYSCTSGHVACPSGWALIQGGDAGPKFFLGQGPKPGDRSVFIYHCTLNP